MKSLILFTLATVTGETISRIAASKFLRHKVLLKPIRKIILIFIWIVKIVFLKRANTWHHAEELSQGIVEGPRVVCTPSASQPGINLEL